MHLPCKQADVGALPTDSTSLRRQRQRAAKVAAPKRSEGGRPTDAHSGFDPASPFHCGENEIQASLISSASVGATPTPATILREVIRLPGCKPGVMKQSRK